MGTKVEMTGHRCPICDSANVNTFLKRPNVPVSQNRIFDDRKSALEAIRGNLTMAVCKNCGFVFNKDFDESLVTYDTNYDNTQTFSPLFSRYVARLVEYILDKKSVQNRSIVEVGCGNGLFLRELIKNGRGNYGHGFDPSYSGPLDELNGKLRFDSDYFNPDYLSPKADVAICRHLIEHIANPVGMIRSVRNALKPSQASQAFFETPCVKWTLINDVHFDIFYEHCSLFSEHSLESAIKLSGFKVVRTCHVFEQQYIWLEAVPAQRFDDPQFNPGEVPTLAQDFARKEKNFIEFWKEKTDSVRFKPLAIWGAGAKGATFLNLIDPKAQLIDYVIDINPCKKGKFIPGTGHEIVGVDQIKKMGIKTAIIMNPNYAKEIEMIAKISFLE